VEPNLVLITFAAVFGSAGIGLLFVGTLMTMLVALGNKHYVWGILSLVFFPCAFGYCAVDRENTGYAQKLLIPGLLLLLMFLGLMWFELNRLGLDFVEVMSTTKPVH